MEYRRSRTVYSVYIPSTDISYTTLYTYIFQSIRNYIQITNNEKRKHFQMFAQKHHLTIARAKNNNM